MRNRLVPAGGGEKVQTYRAAMLWGGDKPIIGLRLDLPEGGPGTTPMQNMEPTLRPNNPMIAGHNPDLYRQMLTAAKETIAEHGLRPWISCEAFNEWLEGSYLEPSTQWGFSYLDAIRDTLGRAEK